MAGRSRSLSTAASRQCTPWVLRALAVVVAMVALLSGSPTAAQAHDVLTGTSPADGSTTAVVPGRVTLTLSQPALAVGTLVIVTGPSGPVQTGSAALAGRTITQRLRAGSPAGRYTVLWRATSGDGHPVSGRFSFTATEGSPAQHTSTTSTTRAVPETSTTSSAALSVAPAQAATSATAGATGRTVARWRGPAAGAVLALLVAAFLFTRKPRSTPRSKPNPPSHPHDPPSGLG